MYYYETILALLLALCFFALIFPYLGKDRRRIIRLTSIYRPISLGAFLIYALLILIKPLTGPLPLLLTPLLVIIGASAMALGAREAAGNPLPLYRQRLAAFSGVLFAGLPLAVFISLQSAVVYYHGLVSFAFAWVGIEAWRLFRSSHSFAAATITASAAIAALGMVFRALSYLQYQVEWGSAFFPDAPGGFAPRMIATFSIFFASVAFNFEDLRLQAVNEKKRAAQLYAGLVQSLVTALEGRIKRSSTDTRRLVACVRLLAEKLQQERNSSLPNDLNFPKLLSEAAQLFDLGLIGIPQNLADRQAELSPEDHEIFSRHPVIGRDLLMGIVRQASKNQLQEDNGPTQLKLAAEIVGACFEHWDGSGFPAGSIGREIPPSARVVAICRDFLKLADSIGAPAALKTIAEATGAKYDPAMIRVLVRAEEDFVRLAQMTKGTAS